MKTIPRNHTRKIAAIKALDLTCRCFSLRNHFAGVEVETQWAWDELVRFDFSRLTVNDAGDVWTIQVHGNLWYELRVKEA